MPIVIDTVNPYTYYNRERGRSSDLMNSLLDRSAAERARTEDRDRMNAHLDAMVSIGSRVRQAERDRGLRMGRVGTDDSFTSPSVNEHASGHRDAPQFHDEVVISPSIRLSMDELRRTVNGGTGRLRPGLFTSSEGRWNSLGPTETNDHTIFNQIMSRYPPFHERTDEDKERLTEELVELLVYRS